MSILDSARKILKGNEKSTNLILLGILLITSSIGFQTIENLFILSNVGQLLTMLGLISFVYGLVLYGLEASHEHPLGK